MAMSAHAATLEQPLLHHDQEIMAQSLFRELRCVVCEGQSLAESDAVLAQQMRAEIRAQVANGQTQTQVLDYFRARYGDAILLNPRLTAHTVLLWLAPLLFMLLGAWVMWRSQRLRATHE